MIEAKAQSPVDDHIRSSTVDDFLFTIRYNIKITGGQDHRPVTHCYSSLSGFFKIPWI